MMSCKSTWLGHSALLIETGGIKILIDPFLQDNPSAVLGPRDVQADFILVSHGHSDHIGDTAAIAKRCGSTVISNLEIANWLEEMEGLKIHGQQPGGGFQHPFGYLKLTQAVHGSSLPDGTYGGLACGFLLTTLDGSRIYAACDTGLFGDMRLIGEEGLDLAFLPIGDNYTMGPEDALRAVKLLSPKTVVPYHYDTWGLITQDPQAWAERVRTETTTQVEVLKPGESCTV
jgi:L-ascorbate metabolism protein UlaG (beta-lactamase superfamily)